MGPPVMLAAVVVLAGCTGDGGQDAAVEFDEVQSATISIVGSGVFVDPGATAAAEGRFTGSGFLVSGDGVAFTASDVVLGADTLSVRLGGDDSEQVTATVLGASECLGIAAVQLEKGKHPYLAWRNGSITAKLDVFASGYPVDAAGAFTSSAGTVTEADVPLTASWASIAHAIAHDAPVTSGASGSALVDAEGRVVGVAHVADDPAAAGFAVHRDVARDALDKLAAGDRVSSIGVNAKGWVSADGSSSGVWAQSVQPASPAAAAGVLPGDLIVQLGDSRVGADGTLADYCRVLRARKDDAALDIEVYRPATDELLAGQVDGAALQVVSTSVNNRSGNFVNVADQSGLLRVDVPVEWGQVDGAGFTDGSGNRWYSIVAAPSIERYQGSVEDPGVQVAATGSGGGAGELLTSLSGAFEQRCSRIDSFQPYDDGVYAGAYSRWECDGTLAFVLSVRNARGNNVAVTAQLRSPFDKQQTLQRVLSTFQLGR